jgi:hypothetical protein
MTEPEQAADGTARLAELSRRLDETAARLQDEDLDGDEAGRLAANCAELAAEAAVELDRLARGGPLEAPPGQEELL